MAEVKREPTLRDKVLAGGLVAALGWAAISWLGGGSGAAEKPAAAPPLTAEAVARCKAALAVLGDSGLIRSNDGAGRIEVDERQWDELPMADKGHVLQAISCSTWQSALPPAGQRAVAYGWRDGERKKMLTKDGIL